jgi:ribosomal protein S18 acetylase RimI-like enzyme
MKIEIAFGYLDYNKVGYNEYCINKVFVHEDCRQQGFGSELFRMLFAEIGTGEIYLIASGNLGTPVDTLVRWYKNIGFKVIKDGTIYNNETEFEMGIKIKNGIAE